MMFTPNNITELQENEIFVFGSNKSGTHAGGAARTAVEKFGAIIGKAEGLQGQSYAIPIVDENMNKVGVDELQESLEKLVEFANEHNDKTFYLTKIGCGIAGFTEDEIIEVLNKIELPDNLIIPEDFNVIYSYKAFDKNMRCRGFQYEEGKSYEERKAIVCKKGFHACRNPFDVLNYYPFVDAYGNFSRFAQVVQSGKIKDKKKDKTCSTKIKIKAEIVFPEFVNTCVEWIKEETALNKIKTDVINSKHAQIGSSGDRAQIGSSGDCAQIGNSGDHVQIGSSGDYVQIGSSGKHTQIGSSGSYIQIGSSGSYIQIGSSGGHAQIGNSGNYAQIGNSGNYARIGNSGNRAQIVSSGYCAQIGNSGDHVQIGSSGDRAQIGSCGDYVQIGSSGDRSQISSSGYCARIQSTGEECLIMCSGINSIASAKKGSWITLSEWEWDHGKHRYIPVCVKTEFVDDIIIKESTPYRLVNGKFEEVKE